MIKLIVQCSFKMILPLAAQLHLDHFLVWTLSWVPRFCSLSPEIAHKSTMLVRGFSDVAYFTAVLYRFLKDLCLFFCNKVLCNNGQLAAGTESLRITATSASCQTREGTLRAGRSDESSATVARAFSTSERRNLSRMYGVPQGLV